MYIHMGAWGAWFNEGKRGAVGECGGVRGNQTILSLTD